ncbi:hypothetical protein H0H92_000898 [Tricholoma furcatifolium]|nr:hypothetical protein H0H92_000898 [Tricholoma furcatifolium]
MIWHAALVLGLAQFGAATLSKRWNDVTVKHSWAEVPRGWEYRSSAPADYKFDMRLALKQHNIDALIANLLETSDPHHSRYGQHLTPAEAEALVAPHPDSREAVEAWLEYHGIFPENIAYSTGGGEWVTIRVSVAEAERMLDAKYNVYHHYTSSEQVVRTMSYSLPRELSNHVDVVTPTTYFGTLRSMRSTSFLEPTNENVHMDNLAAVPSSCQTAINITCLRDLYNTNTYIPSAVHSNSLGIAGYLGEYANYADLQTFYKTYRPDAVNATFQTILVNGGLNDQTKPGVEANLDIQYAAGISFPTPNIYYSTGGSPPFTPDSATPTNGNEPYLDWLNFIMKSGSIPQTISTSYGDDEQTVPVDYAQRVCNLFAQLGSTGTTVVFSSGDYGRMRLISGPSVGAGDCSTNDGTKREIFQPIFPASCSFVTAVGATTSIPEVATTLSGGGFSRYFNRPSYQNAQVNKYLTKLGSTYSGLYSSTGRGYPDVSAQGLKFAVVIGGQVQSVSGTSASAPTVAGILSLLNDARLAANKPSLGFINPLIYANPNGFNDIVSGNNPGCNTNGFSAAAGWDPVTGLGTPDFLKLKALLV